jgi:hypothetical protein
MLLSLEMAYQDPNLDYKAVSPVVDKYLVPTFGAAFRRSLQAVNTIDTQQWISSRFADLPQCS